ncbi:hypothetical protein HY489_03760 [Candidatus Woesearchaeota archaeon]|nr:hypothetical protein [Candidatus Woesearchaeota archaeon]
MSWKKVAIAATFIMAILLVSLSFKTPEQATGLANCPGCKVISEPPEPNHSLFLLALALVVAIVGAHTISHCCTHSLTKKILTGIFALSFIVLTGIFGLSMASPNSATTVIARQSASIFAAIGILGLFHLAAFEMGRFYEARKTYPKEEAEDEWEKRN